MKVLVTGSAGHLGEALVRTLQDASHEVVGLDIVASTVYQPGGVGRGPRLCEAVHGGNRRGAPYGRLA